MRFSCFIFKIIMNKDVVCRLRCNARIHGMLKCADMKLRKYYRLVKDGEMYRFRLTKREEKDMETILQRRRCSACSVALMSLSAARCPSYHRKITRTIECPVPLIYLLRFDSP